MEEIERLRLNGSSRWLGNNGLFITKALKGNRLLGNAIYNNDGYPVLLTAKNEAIRDVFSSKNHLILEREDLINKKRDYYHYRVYNSKIELVNKLDGEPIKLYIEDNERFFEIKTNIGTGYKYELYSLKEGKYVTPKVDEINKAEYNGKEYFIAEDISYCPDIDRENHLLSFTNMNGTIEPFLISTYINDRVIPIDLENDEGFKSYYDTRRLVERQFDDYAANVRRERKEAKHLVLK